MGELYHCGYPGHATEDLRRIAEFLDAVVVDIRYSALMAAEASWRGAELRELLGDRYVRCIALADHAGCGGNEGPISLIDFALGVDFLRQTPGAMILLCGCPETRHSHRAVVALRLWTEHRWESRTLDWEEDSAPTNPIYPELLKSETEYCLSVIR